MTEEEARAWIRDRHGRVAYERCEAFAAMVERESGAQNLISKGSAQTIWGRHIVDSAQLIDLAPAEGNWIDIGTGAGFPGIVVAILRGSPTFMIEPRRRRAAFLTEAVGSLAALNASVIGGSAQVARGYAAVLSARAVAPLSELFAIARHLTDLASLWLLPKGRSAEAELVNARTKWDGVFHVKQSITAPDSSVICATGVRQR